ELQRVETDMVTYTKSRNPADIDTIDYTTHHWLHLLRGLPALSVQEMAALDKAFTFTGIGNAEIACDWYTLSVKNGYETAFPDMAVFLKSVGRRKFLLPIYKNLLKTPKGKALAEQRNLRNCMRPCNP
ncbi:MAG: aminopeptidase, partial [Bacteroidetes bacterium]|nr:aminopeptidase [Bacteroidota bacterium]